MRAATAALLMASWIAGCGDPSVNSLGMRMVRIEPGSFVMGSAEGGEFDERPAHDVVISRPFRISACEVTNAQFERFDPSHKAQRGRRGFSTGDDEAVVFVSWHEAVAFCEWLSGREGRHYRLPTEAEWEYACRAGTTAAYHTGATLPEAYHRHQKEEWDPVPVSLAVGRTPPNPWGLHDLHGNVEEWCLDWYGPFDAARRIDPKGPAKGDTKVARGGSHNTELPFLRSANRLSTLPDDRSCLIGFRVVAGRLPEGPYAPPAPAGRWAQDVSRDRFDWRGGPDMSRPHFKAPMTYVHIPPGSNGPMYSQHNHCPALTACPNGDLLAAWFSTNTEAGREMTILASRLRRGAAAWEDASVFFKGADRNMTGSALWWDGGDTLYHFNGLGAAGTWGTLAVVLRASRDNGATWDARFVNAEHILHNQVISCTLRTREGYLIQACDAVSGGDGGTAIHISRDGGRTWIDPAAGKSQPTFRDGESGAWIAGIHASIVQLADGRLMALGRGDSLAGPGEVGPRMPMSISDDMGATWRYQPSEFPPIAGGQRLVLMRLREGPLLFCSFTDSSKQLKSPVGMKLLDAAGRERTFFGLFAAVSEDDGKTWRYRRLLTHDGSPQALSGGAWTGRFTLDPHHAEPKGYLAATQTPDGVIHLVSSALYYQFNFTWIKTPPPAVPGPSR